MGPSRGQFTLGAICKNCGGNLLLRTEAQGWVHSNYEFRCPPTFAEPVKDPRAGRNWTN